MDSEVNRPTPRYVLPETAMLALLGCFDLIATVYLLATGQAHEANPLMSAALVRFGPVGLVGAKFLMLAIPLAIAEYARQYRPRFVRMALRAAVAIYAAALILAYYQQDLRAFGSE